MWKRHVVVGLAMLAASVVSYEFVTSSEARLMVDVVDATPAAVTAKAVVTPQVTMPAASSAIPSVFESVSDTAVLLATGATLLAIAAGVRRRTP